MTLSHRLATEPPSRELDAEIARAMGFETKILSPQSDRFWIMGKGQEEWAEMPHYTASFDAAMTVVSERLLEWSFEITLIGGWMANATLFEPDDIDMDDSSAAAFRRDDNLAMALLAAVSKAEGW